MGNDITSRRLDECTFFFERIYIPNNSLYLPLSVLPVIDGITPGSGQLNPIQITLTQEDTIDLPCHASGNPQPTIRWFKDGQLVTHNTPGVSVRSRGTILSISRASVIHAGQFTCLATSDIGNATKVFVISVNGKCRTPICFYETNEFWMLGCFWISGYDCGLITA